MVSNTQQSDRRRRIRQRGAGRRQAAERLKAGTPAFPIQPEGYDPNAADAQRPAGSGEQQK